ncbi:transmembrane gamma-carboxyglutamic acid protein 4 [Tachyglossus aculeatus]|uniref:transmembrane gamma-carboxyglutamic acid protein 4 n=1 Tax=Tachyglossus aculeatus TaxID=9261 RepID=UPI0018F55C99|nr:transmembrane gamma-carboxyglutamic acid protein 4 [Tachyglossus aculeatus]
MFVPLLFLIQLPLLTLALPPCTRRPKGAEQASKGVFTPKEEASMFIQRRLLYNRFDLELFTPGDLERECNEELCSYEEAREIFGDNDKMISFWKEYSANGPIAKSDDKRKKIDVMGLVTGLIAAGVILVITGLFGYYLCITKCTRRQHSSSSAYVTRSRHSPSIIFRRPEEISLTSSPLSLEDSGLPSYEQAVALAGKDDIPPPPYPGPAKGFKVFKKSMSLPAH